MDEPSSKALRPPGQSSGSKLRVLVVEDDRTSATALRAILTHRGCEAEVVQSVREGLIVLTAEAMPDVVVLDLMLPDGDGAEILRHVREKMDGQVRVVMTTASSDVVRLKAVEALRPEALLRKPVNVIDLMRAMGIM